MPAFGPIGAYAASDEAHAGFKVFLSNNDRKGLASMDVVAVLTKVVQQQEKTIEQLAARIAEPEATRQAAAPRNRQC